MSNTFPRKRFRIQFSRGCHLGRSPGHADRHGALLSRRRQDGAAAVTVLVDLDLDQRLGWAARHLQSTRWACDTLPPLAGMRLAATLHIDVKFAVAALRLPELGADLSSRAARDGRTGIVAGLEATQTASTGWPTSRRPTHRALPRGGRRTREHHRRVRRHARLDRRHARGAGPGHRPHRGRRASAPLGVHDLPEIAWRPVAQRAAAGHR